MTTDGIHGVLSDNFIRKVFYENELERVPEILVRAAEKSGSKDNMTCMAVKIVG